MLGHGSFVFRTTSLFGISVSSGEQGALTHSRRSHAPTVPQMAFVLGASFVLGIDDQAGQQGKGEPKVTQGAAKGMHDGPHSSDSGCAGCQSATRR